MTYLLDITAGYEDGRFPASLGFTVMCRSPQCLEIKTFDAHDGQGLTPAHTAGPSNWVHYRTQSVGLAIAVGNAVPEVKETATQRKPWQVTVQSAKPIELILKPKAVWDSVIDKARAQRVWIGRNRVSSAEVSRPARCALRANATRPPMPLGKW